MKRRLTTKERLAAKLMGYFEQKFPGEALRLDIYPALGYWRQTRADVMQFTGAIHVGTGQRMFSLGCWESMTDCLKFGYEVSDERGKWRAEEGFIITAKGRSWDRSKF